MATKLNTPVERPSVTDQGVVRIMIRVPHKRNQANDGAIIDRQSVGLVYEVTEWAEDGKTIDQKRRTVPASEWTTPVRNLIKTLYQAVESDAKSAGLIDAGTDEDL